MTVLQTFFLDSLLGGYEVQRQMTEDDFSLAEISLDMLVLRCCCLKDSLFCDKIGDPVEPILVRPRALLPPLPSIGSSAAHVRHAHASYIELHLVWVFAAMRRIPLPLALP